MKAILGLGIAAVLFIGSNSLFVVQESETGVVFRLGEIVRSDLQPGLHVKMPFVNNVRTYDQRIQTLDATPERYLTGELKNLEVDSYIKWRVTSAERFYTAMGGDFTLANQRLSQIIKDGLRSQFGSRTVEDIVSGERVAIADNITRQANREAIQFGIEVVDVRLKRIDLPRDISESVFRRMEAERQRVAADLRSLGGESAERIRADADRQRTVLLAEAFREAEQTRGEGDAIAASIYAEAYGIDPEFYSFYQSLNAYQESFSSKSDMIVLDPNLDFFKHLTR
ncbi:protease modulator HflC [Thiomicrospira sp. ALE5]|uniref:protease modulator HflC n=1 Tax=Thiomicrospira sp. ALE5 TaxID=748650 RepID=UPI0008E5FE25|nr:protease modulator HflC [Thiomicrospira sp. ALE5]SFR59041.1 membrane protease subunit HflC [Thiomicrospira sp. ALE5]